MESTAQALLGACAGAYLVSFLLMGTAVMTEKNARRGVQTPVDYEPNAPDESPVSQVLQSNVVAISLHWPMGLLSTYPSQ